MKRAGYFTLLKCDISRRFHGCAFALLCVGMIAAQGTVHADELEYDETAAAAAIQAEKQTAAEPGIIATLDRERDYLSEKVVAYSKAIDQFFGDERYFQENNKSVIQMELNQNMVQGGTNKFTFEGKAKIDLPAAQKRFQLVIESNPEKTASAEIKKDQPVTTKDTAKSDQYSAALRYEKQEESPWHFSADSGAQLQFPLDFFIRTRGSYSLPFEFWRFKLSESVFWFGTLGLGETTQLDLERKLGEPLLFRATSTATCFETPQKCDLRQDFSLFHTLDERAVMLYQASAIGINKPVLQDSLYVFLVKYRKRIHREWVFFEVTPQLTFPRTDDFRLNASLNARLEVLFGATQ